MEPDRIHLQKRLDQARKELVSGRLLLLAARAVVGANLLLIAFNLWRGWRSSDYYHLFILSVWVGLLVIQGRIHAQKRAEVKRLEQELWVH